ncbi:MAG: ATP-binding cassette domain-containing protein [Rhodocyclaceae bacterium]|nr:ATP-binding cassette domain-containing protein [Rhodocyclaceae bacterium]
MDRQAPIADLHTRPLPISLFALIGDFVRRQVRAYTSAAAMLLGISLLVVWIPRQVGAIVDGLISHRSSPAQLAGELALLLAAGAAIYFMRVGWRLKLFAAAYRLGVELRDRLFQRLTLHDPRFFQHHRTGDLMAMATNDIDAIEMASGEALLAGFDGSLTLVAVVAMMTLGVDWRLALIALLPFPLMAASFWWIARRIHVHSRDALDRFADMNDHVQESLSGVRTLRALGLEGRSGERLSRLAGQASDASLAAQRWEAAYEPAVGVCLATATALTLAMGGVLVWRGELSVGTLTAFSMYLGQMIWPMFAAGWVLSLIERGKAAWLRLAPVLEEAPRIADDGPRTDFRPGTLAIHGLRYRYPGQTRDALADIDLHLPGGRTLGVAGATGAGKSTLLRLLLRQLQPSAGSLLWGDAGLDELRLATLRGAIGWVPQEPFLFSASVADNIALARPEASPQAIEAAARLAAIHDDITRFPRGYATAVGERGVTLSGGQRQRVAIARALLADAPLLLLDDALSAVDTDTETRILAHLRDTRRNRTVIVVSHRLTALMDADHIVVLDAGRIAEQGRHEALVAAGGWYARQWRYQQLQASLEAA